MQKQDVFKPSGVSSFVVSIVMILDGLSMILFGFFYLIGSGNVDFIDPVKKEEMIRQAEIVAVLALVYFIICFLSLIYWQSGSRIWGYIVVGLGTLHLVGAVYLLVVAATAPYADSVHPLPYGSIILNLLLVAIIVYEWVRSKSLAKNSNA